MTISITLSDEQISQLYNSFKEYQIADKNEYIKYRFKTSDTSISVYTSNKVVFQGDSAEIYALTFKNVKSYDHAGSDEVGTGDYFGPVIVCGCICKASDFEYLEKLKINDSKKILDEKIRELAPLLMDRLVHTILILDNRKYNEINKTNNLNKIKARLHNQAYINLSKKDNLPEKLIIDQFTPKDLYFKYLNEETTIIREVHLETKAESKYLAVAAASIIARYQFLLYFDKLSLKYNFDFPKGAGSLVDNKIIEFANKYGKEALNDVAKLHFKNTGVLDK